MTRGDAKDDDRADARATIRPALNMQITMPPPTPESDEPIITVLSETHVSIAPEWERDLESSSFTIPLRALRERRGVLAAVFVDGMGECVDYVASMDPYEAKVQGAHWLAILSDVEYALRASHGAIQSMHVVGKSREIVLREVGEGYKLVLVIRAGSIDRVLLESIEQTVVALRGESGLDDAGVEVARGHLSDPVARPSMMFSTRTRVDVVTREAPVWGYAPANVLTGGPASRIIAVLGRWEEEDLVGFRVRVDTGEELTLLHEVTSARWYRST